MRSLVARPATTQYSFPFIPRNIVCRKALLRHRLKRHELVKFQSNIQFLHIALFTSVIRFLHTEIKPPIAMPIALLSRIFENKVICHSWVKLVPLPVLLSTGLYLIVSAFSSAHGFLDKPIPTAGGLMAYAAVALFIASQIACGLFALYLDIRLVRYLHSEYRAKLMVAQVIARLSAPGNRRGMPQRQRIGIMH